jgi:hypothetical protein
MSKKILATTTVALFLFAALPSVYAFGGFEQGQGEKGKNFNPENREAIEEAIEAEDYAAFIEATGRDNLTEEKFETMVERHSEMEEKRLEKEANRELIQEAVESGDYETWAILIAEQNPDSPMLEKITADNFSQLQEIHDLREELRVIEEDLGIEKGDHRGQGGEHGQRGGQRGFQN